MFFIIGSLQLIFIQSTSGHNIEDEKQGPVACKLGFNFGTWVPKKLSFLQFAPPVGCVTSLPELMGKTPLIVVFFCFFVGF